MDPADESGNYCQEWMDASNKVKQMNVSIGVIVMIMNMVVELSMYVLRDWRKPVDDNKLQSNALSVIACFQFLSMTVVIIVSSINLKIKDTTHFLKMADGFWDDFGSEWYQ